MVARATHASLHQIHATTEAYKDADNSRDIGTTKTSQDNAGSRRKYISKNRDIQAELQL
jgi:hypothetical protein